MSRGRAKVCPRECLRKEWEATREMETQNQQARKEGWKKRKKEKSR